MHYLTILIGVFLGFILFMFMLVVAKKSGMYYLAPLITLLVAISIIAYSLIVVRGFGDMGLGLVGAGFLIVAVGGAVLLPAKLRSGEKRPWLRKDVIGLIVLPIVFVGSVQFLIHLNEDYWIIEQGEIPYADADSASVQDGYNVSTISEGKKMIQLSLSSEEYIGKEIEVDDVKQYGTTVVTLKIVDGKSENKTPLIKIGLDEINEPLKVETTDGTVIQSVLEQFFVE